MLCQAMPKVLILLLESGQSWDFGSGQTGRVTAFPPNPSLQESNSLPRHKQLNVPWVVTRVKLFCSDTVFWELHSCRVSSHRSEDFPVSLKCVRKSVLPSILSQTEPGTDTYHEGVKEKMQSLHRLPSALPFVCGVAGSR